MKRVAVEIFRGGVHLALPQQARTILVALVLLSLGAVIGAPIVPSAGASSDLPHSDAVVVYECHFLEDSDLNYDRWPDRWVRRSSAEFPQYVNMGIVDDDSSPSGRCLRIDLDGASAEVASPPIQVTARFSYVLEAEIKTEKLLHGEAMIVVDLCAPDGRVQQTIRSEAISATQGWLKIRLAVEPDDPQIDRAILSLRVLRGDKPDLDARVSLGVVRLARLARIKVSTNHPFNIYQATDEVLVKCEMSGILEQHPVVRFELLDSAERKLDEATFDLDGKLIIESAVGVHEGTGAAPSGYEGSCQWRPTLPGPGLYCVVVKMLGSKGSDEESSLDRELESRTIWLAALPALEMARGGDFGWTLLERDRPLGLTNLARLLPQVGVNWVKVPLWYDASNAELGNELIRFVELLGATHVEVVGVIDRPPEGVTIDGVSMRSGAGPAIADLLSLDPPLWSPSLDPVMTRLALRVRWWQLGCDRDTSFMGFPELGEQIRRLRARLFRFGQEVNLGLAWDWNNQNQETGVVSWDFQQHSSESALDSAKFVENLARPRVNSASRWVLVDPPPVDSFQGDREEALERQATEFVHRLVAAKEHGADGIFINNPFSSNSGVMRADGSPGQLLLPWRTTSAMLGGSTYLGRLVLPGGSENRIFARPDGEIVMVVWRRQVGEERLFLGENVRQFDLWGNPVAVSNNVDEQAIEVGPAPSFVLGLHDSITRWRMGLQLATLEVPSIFSVPHANSLRFENFFPQGVGGTFKIVVPQDRDDPLASPIGESIGFSPDRWLIEPPHGMFRLVPGEQIEIPFEIRLKNAMYGRQPVRIDFSLDADRTYHFSVYREMEVGTRDLAIEVKTHVDKDGVLVVEQLMSNTAERLADFKCNLYAKGHRRQRARVFRLGPNIDRKVYRYPNGHELVGEYMLLEIEESNGRRVIKYRFQATEDTVDNDADTEQSFELDAGASGEIAKRYGRQAMASPVASAVYRRVEGESWALGAIGGVRGERGSGEH